MTNQGQPTKFKEQYIDQVYTLCCKFPATDQDIADLFSVCVATIYNWKNEHPSFLEAINNGKEKQDAIVKKSLFERATGYEHEDTYFAQSNGEIISETYTKHYPPDTAAAFIWLKNRDPENWRDRKEVKHETDENGLRIRYIDGPASESVDQFCARKGLELEAEDPED